MKMERFIGAVEARNRHLIPIIIYFLKPEIFPHMIGLYEINLNSKWLNIWSVMIIINCISNVQWR